MQIFVQNFTQLLNRKIYTIPPSFVEICLKITKLCCFNQDNPLFLSVLSVVFTSSMLVALTRVGLSVVR